MAWQDSENENKSASDEDDIYRDNVFSGWRKRKGESGSLLGDLMSNPFVWGCAAAVAAVVLLIVLWPSAENKEMAGKLENLTHKLEMLENRIFILESNFENAALKQPGEQPPVEQPRPNDEKVKSLESRVEQLEAALNQRTEKVNAELDNIGKKISAMESRPAAPVKAKPPEPKAKAPSGKYHTVAKGDTLYSVSRKYGLSVEKLVEINKIAKASPIVPGQKLLVSP